MLLLFFVYSYAAPSSPVIDSYSFKYPSVIIKFKKLTDYNRFMYYISNDSSPPDQSIITLSSTSGEIECPNNVDDRHYIHAYVVDSSDDKSGITSFDIPIPLKLSYNQSLCNNKGCTQLNFEELKCRYNYMTISRYEGDTEYQTKKDFITNDKVKALLVFPDTYKTFIIPNTYKFVMRDGTIIENANASSIMKVWIEGGEIYNSDGTLFDSYEPAGAIKNSNNEYEQLISLDMFVHANFRDNKYLQQDNNPFYPKMYDYDVFILGSWDAYNNHDSGSKRNMGSDESMEALMEYYESGKGILLTHDVIGFHFGTDKNYGQIAEKLDMSIGVWEGRTDRASNFDYDYETSYWSDKAKITKKGLITKYPHDLGEIDTEFSVPYTHSTSQLANGNIWMEFGDFVALNSSTQDKPPNSNDSGNYKFYLTTKDNLGMIQTGHGKMSSTESERKILANAIFSLKKRGISSFIDEDAYDKTRPQPPYIESTSFKSDKIIFNIVAKTLGTTYSFTVKGYEEYDNINIAAETNKISITVHTEMKIYYYYIDEEETATKDNRDLFTLTTTSGIIELPNDLTKRKYIHIFSIDYRDLESDVSTFPIPIPLTAIFDPSLSNGKGGVQLNWEEISGDIQYFKVLKYKEGEDPQTISTMDFISGDKVKVLNVYPDCEYGKTNDLPTVTFTLLNGTSYNDYKSASLKVWMEGGYIAEGSQTTYYEPYGAFTAENEDGTQTTTQLIYVTSVPNYYLRDNVDNILDKLTDHDVIFIGTWDTNHANNPYAIRNTGNAAAVAALDKYIEDGYGVLFGHDVLGYRYGTSDSYGPLAHYLNMKIGLWENTYLHKGSQKSSFTRRSY